MAFKCKRHSPTVIPLPPRSLLCPLRNALCPLRLQFKLTSVNLISMSEKKQHIPVRLSASTKEKLKEAGVAVVYFFGSRTSGSHFSFSDIDIGIVMENTDRFRGKNSNLYTEIYDIISTDLPDFIDGPKLDIAFLQKANPALAMKAIHEGEILFESSPLIRADFEELTFKLYNDYLKLQREYQEANIKAFE